MAGDVIVCWNCHAVVVGDQSECPVCKAGIVSFGGDGADERWRQEQQHLKRQLGVSDSDERVVRPGNQRKGMSTGAKFAVFVGGMLVSLVVVVGILLGYVLSTLPDLTGPGTAYYLDTHLCSEVPEPVLKQILEEECEALSSDTCVLSLGVAAATRLEDGLWLVYGDLIGTTEPQVGSGIYGFPLLGQPQHWLMSGAFDGSGSSTRLDNGEFGDLLDERQIVERKSEHGRDITGPPPPAYCLNVIPQPSSG